MGAFLRALVDVAQQRARAQKREPKRSDAQLATGQLKRPSEAEWNGMVSSEME